MVFAFIDVILSVNASADTVAELRDTVTILAGSEAWATAFEGTETYIVNADNATAVANKTNAAIVLNSN